MWKALVDIGGVIYRAIDGFIRDQAEVHGAALAFYALFTVGPLLVIATATASMAFGEQAVAHEVSRQLETILTPSAAKLVERMVAKAARPQSGVQATILGIATLLFGATRGFANLQASLNAVWGVRRKAATPGRVLRTMLYKRLLSFLAVLALGLVFAASLVLTTVIGIFGEFLGQWLTMPAQALRWLDSGVDFLLLVLFLGLIYKTFPDADVWWRDVAVGAVVTSLLLVLGQLAFTLYVTNTAVTSGYGPAGSLVALVLLAYLSALAFLFGAELTEAWAARYGRKIRPSEHAVRIETVVHEAPA